MSGSTVTVSYRGGFLEFRDGEDAALTQVRARSMPPTVGHVGRAGSPVCLARQQQLYVETLLARAEGLVRKSPPSPAEENFGSENGALGKSSPQLSSMNSPLQSYQSFGSDLHRRFSKTSSTSDDSETNAANSALYDDGDYDDLLPVSRMSTTDRVDAETLTRLRCRSKAYEPETRDAADSPDGESVSPSPRGRTLMIRNIPCRVTHEDLARAIGQRGFDGRYDHLYIPMSHRPKVNVGYAFVNLADAHDEETFTQAFDGFRFPDTLSQKACTVQPARLQGSHTDMAQFSQRRKPRARARPVVLRAA